MHKINLTPEGTEMNVDEFIDKSEYVPHKMELIGGRVYENREQRILVLGFLLENLGVDMAVQIGDPQVWRDAVARLDDK